MIQQDDPSITWARFHEIINDLRARKILQGETTLYITPKLLHIKLWVDWWNIHGSTFSLEDFTQDLPGALTDWFFEMCRYGEESRAAQRVFENCLTKEVLSIEKASSKIPEPSLFLALTEASPRAALRLSLNGGVGGLSKEELLNFTTGRREVDLALNA